MKMANRDFNVLKSAIDKVLADHPEAVENYRNGNFPRAAKCKDVNMRFRWDCLYAAKLGTFVTGGLYAYLNDAHIDTALRSICPEI